MIFANSNRWSTDNPDVFAAARPSTGDLGRAAAVLGDLESPAFRKFCEV